MGQEQVENKRLLTDKEEWEAFDKAMRIGAIEDKIRTADFNDYCLPFSEDANFWGVIHKVKVTQDAKTLKAAGEWLESVHHYVDCVGGRISRGFLITEKDIETLKQGKMPSKEE